MRKIWSLLTDQDGATAIEYAFIALLISVAIVFSVIGLGQAVNGKFEDVHEKTSDAMRPPG